MKFTLSWLKDHLDTQASLNDILDTLVRLGLEVESVHNPADNLKGVIVGFVKEATQHPNADRLRVCTVDDGSGKDLQIVCGASNARANMKVALAPVGTLIPSTGQVLKKGVIREVESQGMMCSASELNLEGDNDGIMDLQTDAAPGTPLAQILQIDDPIIDISITPNRSDCFGIRGIARDLAAAGLGQLKPLHTPAFKEENASSPISIKIIASDACPYYTGRLIRGVKNGPSPAWMQQRLKAVGLRPISTLVDITNYLTYDLGRPTHVFDASTLSGGEITIRYAHTGETLKALNDNEYKLDESMLVISDNKAPQALGGIMGGLESGCSDQTVDVFLESAVFDPIITASTGRKLNLLSDARTRFERGVDTKLVKTGLDIATDLILQFAGTQNTAVYPAVIAGQNTIEPHVIKVTGSKFTRLTGLEFDVNESAKILSDLGCEIVEKNPPHLCVSVPSWRHDINQEVDLVEEILRLKGYDKLEQTPLNCIVYTPNTEFERKLNLKKKLAARGLYETLTWSFMDEHKALGTVSSDLKLANPISQDLNMMRPNLVANLLQACARNQARAIEQVSLFEVGPQFKMQNDQLMQEEMVCGLRANTTSLHWDVKSRPLDVFDAKADFLNVLEHYGIGASSIQITGKGPEYYHPGRSATVTLGKKVLGYFGEIHPAILEKFDCKGPVVAFEVNLDNLPPAKEKKAAKKPIVLSLYQPVERDFAFIVDQEAPSEQFTKSIMSVDKQLITQATIFDVYQGDRLEKGKKSLAIRVRIEPLSQTLTEQDLLGLSEKIIQAVQKLGGVLRQA